MPQRNTIIRYVSRGNAELRRQITSGKGMKEYFTDQGVAYLKGAARRFRKFSRGGGSWPKLADRTIREKGHSAILIDKHRTLLRALKRGAPGNVFRVDRKRGVATGYGGNAMHPTRRIKIADLAKFHDQGKGKLPMRTIIAGLGEEETREMKKVAKAHGVKWLKKAAAKQRSAK